MTSNDCKSSCHTTLRDRNTRIRWNSNRTAHARDDLITNPRLCERLALLPTAPKDEWVATLEANDGFPFSCLLNQQSIDLFLRAAMSFGFLAYINQFCTNWNFIQ